MRRWTIRILLCVLLGVVTTVGVAWLMAMVLPRVPGGDFDQVKDASDHLR